MLKNRTLAHAAIQWQILRIDVTNKAEKHVIYLFCENFKVNSCYICHWLNYVLLNKDGSAVSFCQQVAAWVPDIFCDFYLVKTVGSFRKK